jgi:hypothetical protein
MSAGCCSTAWGDRQGLEKGITCFGCQRGRGSLRTVRVVQEQTSRCSCSLGELIGRSYATHQAGRCCACWRSSQAGRRAQPVEDTPRQAVVWAASKKEETDVVWRRCYRYRPRFRGSGHSPRVFGVVIKRSVCRHFIQQRQARVVGATVAHPRPTRDTVVDRGGVRDGTRVKALTVSGLAGVDEGTSRIATLELIQDLKAWQILGPAPNQLTQSQPC